MENSVAVNKVLSALMMTRLGEARQWKATQLLAID